MPRTSYQGQRRRRETDLLRAMFKRRGFSRRGSREVFIAKIPHNETAGAEYCLKETPVKRISLTRGRRNQIVACQPEHGEKAAKLDRGVG